MEIKIKAESNNEGNVVVLTDDFLDNDAYIEIQAGGERHCVFLNELMSAIIAFDAKRSRRLSEEEKLP